MIIEINELDYLGFHLEHVKNTGWKIVMKDVEFLFPNLQDAQAAVNTFHKEAVPKYRGKRIK